MNIVKEWASVKSDVHTRRESVASLAWNIACDIRSECGQIVDLGEYLRVTFGYYVLSGKQSLRGPNKMFPTPIGYGETSSHWSEPLGYYKMFVHQCDQWLAKEDAVIRAELELLLAQRS